MWSEAAWDYIVFGGAAIVLIVTAVGLRPFVNWVSTSLQKVYNGEKETT